MQPLFQAVLHRRAADRPEPGRSGSKMECLLREQSDARLTRCSPELRVAARRLRAASRSAPRCGLAVLLALVAVAATGCGPRPRPRNVLLVSIDTLRADHVGVYGHEAARTPTLDRLAARGARFTQAVSPAPITLVSHASLLTGKIPPRHGVRDNGRDRLHPAHETLAERLRAADRATGAFVGAYVLDSSFGLDQGFDRYDDSMSGQRSATIGYAERRAADVVEAAGAWLDDLPPERPFFAWVHFYDPHADYDPPIGFRAAVMGHPYDAEIAYVDFQLGRLLERLDAAGRREGTLVVVTSDHGESLGEHGEPTHTHFIYDATQLVPLILEGPGAPAGRVVETQVRLVDVAPTVLDLTGLAPLPDAQGRSLVPLLDGEAEAPGPAYLETLAPRRLGWSPLFGLRLDGKKYIRAPRPELYDLEADPEELENRMDRDPGRARTLDARLDELLAGPAPPRAGVELDDEAVRRLEALGYVAGSGPDGSAAAEEGRVGGVDPKDGIEVARRLNVVSGHLEAGRFGRAAEMAAALRQRFPDGPMYAQVEAVARLRLGQADRAAELAAGVVRQDGTEPDAWALLAEAEAARGRLEAAREALDAGRSVAPGNPALERSAVAIELGAGNPAEAQRIAGEALQEHPRDLELRVLRGRVQRAKGEREAARRTFAEVLEEAPEQPEATLRLALLEIEAGEIEVGRKRLSEVPAGKRRSAEAAVEIARAFAAGGAPEQGLETLRSVLERTKASPPVWEARGQLLLDMERPAEAEQAFRVALLLDPGRIVAANNLASLLAGEQRDLDRALELARRAAEAAPGAVTADTLAAVHLARDEPGPALEAAREGLQSGSGEAAARLHYRAAQALLRLGRSAEARDSLRAALDRPDGGAPEAWRRDASALGSRLGLE